MVRLNDIDKNALRHLPPIIALGHDDGEHVRELRAGISRLSLDTGKREIPATGVAGGIERLMISIERASLFPKLSQSPKVFAAAVNEHSRHRILNMVMELRKSGISCDYDMKKRSLRNQLEYVDSMGIPIAIILGPKELEKGVVKVRDMRTHMETEVKTSELIREVTRKL